MPGYWYDHIHLACPDPVKTAEFYEKMFDAKRLYAREIAPGRMSVELSLNGSRILIMQREAAAQGIPPSTTTSLDHFGIRTDDLAGAVAHLKANGAKMRDEIREFRPGIKIAFVWGPDNVLIELVEVTPRS